MDHQSLENIIRSAAVPSMPAVAVRCYEITQDPACSYAELVGALSADPGLASEVLRMSNSALFGIPRRVGSLKQAVALLGLRRVRDLVLTRYMVQSLSKLKTDPIDMSHFWRRSVGTAVISSRLAAASGSRRQDEIGMAGLLADVGVIVLQCGLSSAYEPIASQYRPLGGDDWMAQEQSLLGMGHAEVTARVLENWYLPAVLADAVRFHHHPGHEIPAGRPGAELGPLIGAAQVVAGGLCEARDPGITAARIVTAFERAGLGSHQMEGVLARVESDVQELATVLKVDVIPAHAYHLIAEKVAERLASSTAISV